MSRLTERTPLGIVGNNNKVANFPLYKVAKYDELDRGIVGQCFEKLADYEDAEDQGLLLRLPLQEGTQVYCIGSCGEICDDYSTDCEVCGEHKVVFTTAFDRNMIEQFGKTVFEKEEEANQALADMEV